MLRPEPLSGYSGIEHFAKSIALSRVCWPEVIFLMFTACFDASGTEHDRRFLVVAGFVSTADLWTQFDEGWRKRLREDGLSYFHMVEFAQSSGQFKDGWKGNESRRRKLLSDLMEILQRYAFRKFGCCIENKLLQDHLSDERKNQYHLRTFSLAGYYCAVQVHQWHNETHPRNPVKLVYEDGDLGKGDLIKRLKEDGYGTPDFEPKKDTPTKLGMRPAFTPLQAADFLAYEIALGAKHMELPERETRWGLEVFNRIPGGLAKHNQNDFEKLEQDLTFSERMHGWWKKIGVG